ncbi:hypothetical protein ANCCAN_01323 [Ancylostoma caninum]|uniref:Uncharacterized protein n=1 Tax=Ancylostoma caninum TaxID=29170 RepID=A0A368H7T0_ANCCA|nr:hypothetical protein ANCCAN_01323 [Ancylostoma caninum]
MGRNHHGRGHTNTAPSFMRHGHINHQQTTRLMADQDGSVVSYLHSLSLRFNTIASHRVPAL